MNTDDLMDKYRSIVKEKQYAWNQAKTIYEKECAEYEKVLREHENHKQAQEILQESAQEIQSFVHTSIRNIVNRCLSSVFKEPYTFDIVFEQKRGKTEAELVFLREGMEVDPMTASGGGVIDVAAFALRLAALMLSVPAKQKMLVLDEPFKFVSEEYRQNIREMLVSLAEELGIKFLMVTHIDELKMGNIIEIG